MITLILFASAFWGIFYIGLVVYRAVTADTRGGISGVLSSGVLFKMALAFLALGVTLGAIYLGGTASGISGSGGDSESRHILEVAAAISQFCLFASLALSAAAVISYLYKKALANTAKRLD
ncbi:hypothetical protein [Pseudomonas viridiflava]|uniref:Uncharacterized protein n=1 Tax=Pseudomonas viridiflava TaxID=33069 RepID=A0A3M5PD24_PSEVI|nr:hypothetical protein [Pseudomonas viridiflava]RMT82472.1 hypothetical protein ALP40_00020 [Pseudomonas viridiflava]